jgi:anti-sigma factor RsiW
MQHIDELMQLAIDGAATPAQQEELRARLESSPEARADYDALRELADVLDRMPLVDSPSIKPGVMAKLPVLTRAERPRSPVLHWATRRRALAFAYVAAAIVIVMVALRHTAPSPPNSSATMIRVETEWPVVARAVAPAAQMTIRGDGEEYVVAVSGDVPYSLDWDHGKLSRIAPNRFRRQPGATGPAVIRLRLPDNSVLNAAIDLR